MSELWEQPGDAALPERGADPGAAALHQIPAPPRNKQPAAELLQTGRNREGVPQGHAHTGHDHQAGRAAPEQWENAPVSRDVELLRGQEPTQGDEGGTAA